MADANVTANDFLKAAETGDAEANKHIKIRLCTLHSGAAPFTLVLKCNFFTRIATIIVAKITSNQMNRAWVTMTTDCL